MAKTLPRQNYHSDCEAGVNKQISVQLNASYAYQSLAWYFDRDDVALCGIHRYFKHRSDEEREHATQLMYYQNQRGGRILLADIKKPDKDEWGTALEAMESALAIDKSVNQSLLDLHKVASEHIDAQMCDCLEKRFLEEQVHHIKMVADHITNLRRVGPGLGEFMFDQHVLDCHHSGDGTGLGVGAGQEGAGQGGGQGVRQGAGQGGAGRRRGIHQCPIQQ